MTCERFQEIAGVLMMDADERHNALAHIETCERCEHIFATQSRLSESLRLLAEEVKTVQAPGSLEDKVLSAFRERTRFVSVPVSRSRRPYWAGAVAAVLLLAVGLLGWRWYIAPVPAPTERAASENAAAKVAESGLNREPSATEPARGTRPPNSPVVLESRRIPSRRHSRKRVAQPGIAKRSTAAPSLAATIPEAIPELREITSDFVPVGYGSALDLQEGGQMFRVELPRSALVRFGLPMNMNRADEKIKADVLVGADGLARAIRFVHAVDKPTAGLRPENERNEQ